MDAGNLAIVFATNIMKAEEETMVTSLKFNHVKYLIKLMIEKCDDLSNLLPKEDEIPDNWEQELLKFARISPIHVEEKKEAQDPGPPPPPKPAEPQPFAPPATRPSRSTSTSASDDSKRKKDKSAKSSIWGSKDKK